MIKDALLSYYCEQKDIIIKNWEAALKSHDVDALHDLRVGIKRIKVLFQLLQTVSASKFDYKTHFSDLRKLFKAVGMLRDIQVQSRLFSLFAKENPLEDYKEFYLHLKEMEKSESAELLSKLASFNPKVMEDSFVEAALILEEVSNKKAVNNSLGLLSKRLKQIKSILPNKNDEEQMHEMRKKVKQAIYIIEMLKLINPELKPLEDLKLIKQAADFLGLWHDYVILEEHITKFISENKSLEKKEKELFQSLIANISLEEKFLLEKAVVFLTRVKFNAF